MTSKELNEILNKTRRTPNISLTPEQVEELIKDLDQKELLESELKLEKDKVKYVMKQLKEQDKILEILKNNLYVNTEYTEENDYEISIYELTSEEKEKVKEWLGNENENNCSFK